MTMLAQCCASVADAGPAWGQPGAIALPELLWTWYDSYAFWAGEIALFFGTAFLLWLYVIIF